MEWFRPNIVRASLADQGQEPLQRLADRLALALVRPDTLAIALGANLPSPAGEPAATLAAVKPALEQLLRSLGGRCHWSPLLRTAPVGGPPGQSDYLNAVVVVELPTGTTGGSDPARATAQALALLQSLQQLEARFGRPPLGQRQHWGPRSLDLDLLWWGELRLDLPATPTQPALQLPHPRWRQRTFVLDPLAALLEGGYRPRA